MAFEQFTCRPRERKPIHGPNEIVSTMAQPAAPVVQFSPFSFSQPEMVEDKLCDHVDFYLAKVEIVIDSAFARLLTGERLNLRYP
ncbi:MAG: hypothetical protein WA213_05510 [Terriglobales bacterium]